LIHPDRAENALKHFFVTVVTSTEPLPRRDRRERQTHRLICGISEIQDSEGLRMYLGNTRFRWIQEGFRKYTIVIGLGVMIYI
jgi:hypothetical protein